MNALLRRRGMMGVNNLQGLKRSIQLVQPDKEYGRYSYGGYPTAETYLKSMLPSNWQFAYLRLKEGDPGNFGAIHIALNKDSDTVNRVIRYGSTHNIETAKIEVPQKEWSVVISPLCTYTLEVFWEE